MHGTSAWHTQLLALAMARGSPVTAASSWVLSRAATGCSAKRQLQLHGAQPRTAELERCTHRWQGVDRDLPNAGVTGGDDICQLGGRGCDSRDDSEGGTDVIDRRRGSVCVGECMFGRRRARAWVSAALRMHVCAWVTGRGGQRATALHGPGACNRGACQPGRCWVTHR